MRGMADICPSLSAPLRITLSGIPTGVRLEFGPPAEMIVRVTFDEALAILHGWLGDELEVAIRTTSGLMVADLTGRLAMGSDLSPPGEQSGPIYFQLDGVGGAGFFLAERDFHGAEWQDAERTLLAVQVNGVELLIDSNT